MQSLESYLQTCHSNCNVRKADLHVRKDYPFLGASPDGIVTCDCCPPSVVEVKCSYAHRDKTAEELQALVSSGVDPSMCLDTDMTLKRSHKYYTHVQSSMVNGTDTGHSWKRRQGSPKGV